MFFSYEGESQEPYFESVISPMFRTLDETVSNDMRLNLLANIVNNCRDGLCRLLEGMVKSEYGIDLSLDKLYAGIVNQGESWCDEKYEKD